MPRARKSDDEAQTADIRIKLTDTLKAEFQAACEEDGMDAVSVWLKWLAKRRIRQLDRERGKNPRRST